MMVTHMEQEEPKPLVDNSNGSFGQGGTGARNLQVEVEVEALRMPQEINYMYSYTGSPQNKHLSQVIMEMIILVKEVEFREILDKYLRFMLEVLLILLVIQAKSLLVGMVVADHKVDINGDELTDRILVAGGAGGRPKIVGQEKVAHKIQVEQVLIIGVEQIIKMAAAGVMM